MTLKELERQIHNLTPIEKSQMMQLLFSELSNSWLGIEKTPGVVGGDACIVRTRIPVWALEQYRRLGWSEAKILENFPSLRAVDLVHAWGYADTHVAEIEQALREQTEA